MSAQPLDRRRRRVAHSVGSIAFVIVAPMPKQQWLMRFAARMRQIFPLMKSGRATHVALAAWPDAHELEPDDAAEIYACVEGCSPNERATG